MKQDEKFISSDFWCIITFLGNYFNYPLNICILFSCRSVEDGGLWSLTLENYIFTNNLAATHDATVRRLYGSADRLIIYLLKWFNFHFQGLYMLTVIMILHIEYCLSLLSLFSVSQSKLSTLQVLCPTMTKEDRETLIALATAGIINWQENDGENTHTHTRARSHTHKRTYRHFEQSKRWSFLAVCHRCVWVSGGAAVLSKSRHTSRWGDRAGNPGHRDGVEEQQGGLVPLWQVM